MVKKKVTKKRGEYEDPLKVEGSLLDILQAAAKHADKKTTKVRKPKK